MSAGFFLAAGLAISLTVAAIVDDIISDLKDSFR